MEDRTHNGYTIRAGVPTDVPKISALFNEVYGDSSHPCAHPEYVHASLQRDIWQVALDGQEIVSCTAGLWHDWNQMYERARMVTHPEFRANGMARQLMDAVLDVMWARPTCDMVIGYTRSEAITRLLFRETQPPFIIVGHDGGMDIADGIREYHLLGMSVNPDRQPLRITPSGPTCYSSTFIDGHLLSRFTFRTQEGVYPPAHIVGPATDNRVHAGAWRIGYAYDPNGQSLHITELQGPVDDPDRRLDGLASCLQKAPDAEHRWAFVLYDKTELILGMQELGFQVTAFLPGWFCAEGARYDCVLLTQCTSPEPPVARGTQEFITLFDSCLNQQTALA